MAVSLRQARVAETRDRLCAAALGIRGVWAGEAARLADDADARAEHLSEVRMGGRGVCGCGFERVGWEVSRFWHPSIAVDVEAARRVKDDRGHCGSVVQLSDDEPWKLPRTS